MKRVQTAIGIAGGLIGLAAYLYLLGGLVTWLRLTAARLPTDDALRALDSRRLLAVGMKALFFELVLMAVLLGLTWAIWGLTARRHARGGTEAARSQTSNRAEEVWLAWILVLQGVVAGVLAGALSVVLTDASEKHSIGVGLALGSFWLAVSSVAVEALEGHDRLRRVLKIAFTSIAAVLAVLVLEVPSGVAVLVLLLLMHLSERLAALPEKRDPARLVPAVLVLASCLSLIVGAYLATPPVALNKVTVEMREGQSIEGGYLGQTGEGVFLATCLPRPEDPRTSRANHLELIPSDRVERVVLGGPPYVFDYGKDPSLFDLALYFLEPDEIEQRISTVAVDFRESKFVCGLRHFLRPTGTRRPPGGRVVEQRVKVEGPGRLVLTGESVLPQVEQVTQAEEIALPIVLSPGAERTLRCGDRFEADVEIRFTFANGDVEKLPRTVTIPTGSRLSC